MRFPLSIVDDFLRSEGYTVAQAPRNLRDLFDWVDDDSQAAPDDRVVLRVGSAYQQREPHPPAIIVCAGSSWRAASASAFAVVGTKDAPSVIAGKIQRYLLSLYEWVEKMHHALARHCTCTELLEISEPILKNYISVSDSLFSYVGHTPNIDPIEDASRHLLQYGRYSEETIRAVQHSDLSERWTKALPNSIFTNNAVNPLPSIEHVYHLNGQYAAHLVMVCPTPITAGQEFLFSQLIEPIETILKGQWQTDNPLKQRYTSFLANLIHEDSSSRENTFEQARLLGIPSEGVFKVCVVDKSWKGGSSAYFMARATALIPGCKIIADNDRLVMLLHTTSANEKSRLSLLEQKAFELTSALGTQVGVSRKFFSILGAANAFAEADVALAYGKMRFKYFIAPHDMRPDNPDTYIFRFKRYFPFFVGDPDADTATFLRKHDIASQVLGHIEQDDLENGTSDLNVLKTYLYTGTNRAQASELLDMHRNSLAYRLRHIEDTYDLKLSDADERAFLNTLFLLPRR